MFYVYVLCLHESLRLFWSDIQTDSMMLHTSSDQLRPCQKSYVQLPRSYLSASSSLLTWLILFLFLDLYLPLVSKEKSGSNLIDPWYSLKHRSFSILCFSLFLTIPGPLNKDHPWLPNASLTLTHLTNSPNVLLCPNWKKRLSSYLISSW